ncbi:MAG: sigma-54-dependent Fis family transcriptional regulator [Deltaproteobacteria bacterium]|nr:sigma-54-dependent Fis family transcriptional regulator [Deltaproteobacteria bacterium]MCW5802480.1 sigma-54-dependent Fis family transcriptional regulator [Deltaproteobacteria bacterium]
MLVEHLQGLGYAGRIATSGRAAIAELRERPPDLVITDLRMAEVDGLDVVDAVRGVDPELPVIVVTAFGGVESAIEAVKRGAYHYLTKPLRLEELVLHVRRALEQRALRRDHRRLRDAARTSVAELIGQSAAMRRLYALIDRVSPSPSPVLVRGESGSGKELVARAIHERGPRRDRAFVAVNCTALPEALLESELFGHARGAFTGATAARAGLFVEASGGTLFLDEIGDMPLPLQARLLRVLQEGEVRAIGTDSTRHVDVRVIAATHQDLDAKIAAGQFRADLFYRLDVVPVRVPPLRDRLDDLAMLTDHFLGHARRRNPHAHVERISRDVATALARYPWPGNVRELQNLIERLVVVGANAEANLADLADLAPKIAGGTERFSLPRDRLATLREVEDEYIEWMIEQCGGNKTRAAERLGIDKATLHRRAKQRPRERET